MCVRELILRIFDAKIELLLSIFRVLSIAQAIILCILYVSYKIYLLFLTKSIANIRNNTYF